MCSRRKNLMAEVSGASKSVGDDEKQRVIEEYQQRLAMLDKVLDFERARQEEALAARLAQRK